MLVIFVGVYTYSRVTGNSIEFEGTIFEAVTPKETKNILVAALHTEGPLTDFIMLVQYNPILYSESLHLRHYLITLTLK